MNSKSILRPLFALFFVSAALASRPASAFEVIGKPTPLTPSSSIEIRFLNPIVDDAAVGKSTDRLPVVTEPALDGHFIWDSRRSGRIILHSPPAIGTRYEISPRPGLKTAAGDPVESDRVAVIRSAGFQVASRLPRYFRNYGNSPSERTPTILLEFNDPIDPKAVSRSIFFQDKSDRRIAAKIVRPKAGQFPEKHKHPMTWEEQFEAALAAAESTSSVEETEPVTPPVPRVPPVPTLPAIPPLPGAAAEAPPLKTKTPSQKRTYENALLVTPKTPLPVGENWTLTVGKGTPNSAGTASLDAPYVVQIGNIKPFTISSVSPVNPYDDGLWFQVYFSKGFPEKTTAKDIADWISVSPEPENLKLELQGRSLSLKGDFVRGKSYRVVVRPGLQAADGTFLDVGANKSFVFAPNEPYLNTPALEATQISSGQKRFDIASGNLSSVRIRVKLLEGNELPYALRGYEKYESNANGRSGLTYDLVPGRTIFEKELPSTVGLDERELFTINWKEVLGAERNTGAVFIHVEGSSKKGVTRYSKTLGSQALIQITDIGLVTKLGHHNALVYAFSHKDGSPLVGVELDIIDRENRPVGKTKTDKNGVAEFPITKESHWLSATLGKDRHVIGFHPDMSTLPTWGYGIPVDWRRPADFRRRTFAFVDRPVYRPGETVHLKAHARQLIGDVLKADAGATAKLQLRDPRYRTILEKEITFSETGAFDEDIVIPSAGILGRYSVRLDFGTDDDNDYDYSSRYANLGFQVADFRPNTFEATLKADPLETGATEATVDLTANYYMGKPLSKAKVTWHSNIRSTGFNPKGFDTFVFGGGRDFEESEQNTSPAPVATYGELALGESGNAQLKVPVPSADGKPGARIFSVTTEVTDINQQTVAASKSLRIEGSQFYLGVARPPYLNKSGSELPITLVAIDAEGKPLADPVESKVTIERNYYNTVRVKAVGGGTSLQHKRIATKVFEKDVTVAPVVAKGGQPADPKPAVQFTPKDPGSYTITVESKDAAGNPVRSGSYFYVYGGAPSWAVNNGTKIDLVPERTDYKPGETATILLKTPVFGTALVTVERTGILSHFVTEITEEKPVIEIPLTEAESPNAFVSVMLIRGAANSGKKFPEPEFRLGYCQLMVESHGYKLDVAVTSSQSEYQPGDEVELTTTVHDAAGNPVPDAEVTLYAVDEGVLSLMGYITPDPNTLFHTPLSLAVRTAISLTRLIPEDPDERDFGNKGFVVGGGGDGGEQRLRDDFRPCAFWAASLKTDKDGKTTGKFTAPDGLTRYRTIAVVAAGAERFGNAEGAIVVNKPLMIDPVVPRFANLSDQIWVKAVLHNTSGASGEFEIALTLNETTRFNNAGPGPKLTGGPKPLPAADRTMRRNVTLKSGETGRVVFPVTFEKTGTARWEWSAKAIKLDKKLDRPLQDRVESKFEVRTPLPLLRESHYITLNGGGKAAKNVLSKFSPELLEGEGEIIVTLSKTRLLEAKDATDYILKYPYGCAEQTTSSLLPWLQLRDLRRALPSFSKHTDDEISAAIQNGADRILSMQTESGGLAYWPGGNTPELWASGYAGMGLLLAEKAGAKVPKEAIKDLKEWLSKQLRDLAKESDYRRLTDTALALYTLALAGAPESGYHDVLYKRRAELNQETRYLLALTIAEAGGDRGLAQTLLTEAPANTTKWKYWLGNDYAKALKLLAWSRLDPASTEIGGALTELLNARDSRGTWGCTWNNAWSMLALGAYAKNEKIAEPVIAATYSKGAKNGKLTLGAGLSSTELTLPFRPADGDAPLSLEIPKDSTVYAHIEVKARPKLVSQKPRANGLSILRKYNKVLPDGSLAPAKDLEIGDMVRVQLDIEIPGDTHYVAVDDPLPAAFEAVNPEFKTQASRQVEEKGWTSWYSDYRELRADRALFFRDHISSGGKFTLRYLARVIADGDTIAPPAKVEAMYHPDIYGLSATDQINTHK